jgi:hypothetical protein
MNQPSKLIVPDERKRSEFPAPVAQENTPATLLAYLRAAESGADLDRLEKLMDLHERFEKTQAVKAFNQAVADFRSETITLLKTKYVDIAGGPK